MHRARVGVPKEVRGLVEAEAEAEEAVASSSSSSSWVLLFLHDEDVDADDDVEVLAVHSCLAAVVKAWTCLVEAEDEIPSHPRAVASS